MSKLFTRAILSIGFLMLMSMSVFAQTASLTGRITDSDGQAVLGATVQVQGTQAATASGPEGAYSFQNIAVGNQTITVTAMGYKTASKSIMIKAGENVLDIVIENTASDLDEIVVIGYGVTRKKQISGSVASVGPKDFNKGVVSSPDQLLAGKVAGLTVNRSGGDPTAGATVQLRGPSSLTASSSPLYVIDGVPMDADRASEFGLQQQGPGISPLSLIPPEDVESIEILKDAQATSLYGSRGHTG